MSQRFEHVSANALIMGLRPTCCEPVRGKGCILCERTMQSVGAMILEITRHHTFAVPVHGTLPKVNGLYKLHGSPPPLCTF